MLSDTRTAFYIAQHSNSYENRDSNKLFPHLSQGVARKQPNVSR